jgi:hypothetical protein
MTLLLLSSVEVRSEEDYNRLGEELEADAMKAKRS